MNKAHLESLEKVDASTLPAKVLVLLSRYATALNNHNGLVIQLSSIDVFKDVHRTNLLCEDPSVQKFHRQLLVQVGAHVKLGSMYLIGQKPIPQLARKNEINGDKRQKLTLNRLVRKSSFNRASSSPISPSNVRSDDIELLIAPLR